METIDYQKQAQDFLTSTGTELKAEFKRFGKHFEDDKTERFIFKVTIKRGKRSFSFDYGSSIADAESFFKDMVSEDWRKHFKYPARVLKDEDELKSILPFINKHKDKITLPSAYDVLACLTKQGFADFEDFCEAFGYDADSKKAEKVYDAVCKEWANVQKIWTDAEIEKLAEIN